MDHGLFDGEESDTGDIKVNIQQLGKHHLIVLPNCKYIKYK